MKTLGVGVVLAAAIFAASWWATPTLGQVVQSRTGEVVTTACGVASGTNGTAVLIGDQMVLTAAHLIIGAGSVAVDFDGATHHADIVGLDPRSDLALLEVPSVRSPDIHLGIAENGEEVVFGSHDSEFAQSASITRHVEIRIEEERSTVRSSRFGFELDVTVELGDSGSGVFDVDANLLGIIFGRSTTRENRSFAVRSSEISALLDGPVQRFECDPSQDRVLPVD